MLKKISLLFVIVSLSGCNDINYDSETRLVIQGQLIDRFGDAVPNQSIDIAVYNNDSNSFWENNSSPAATDVISYGYSDESGMFKLVIPAPKGDNDHIGVRINHHSGSFQNKEFLFLKRENFIDYRFDLSYIDLYRDTEICTLFIQPQNTNPSHELGSITVEGLLAEQYVYINPIPTTDLDLIKQVLKNQTVTIHYEVVDYSGGEPVTTQNSINVPIGYDPMTYYNLNF